MDDLEDILRQNKNWAAGVKKQDGEFFPRLAQGQSPKILWVGCADSRVPPSQITGLPPGALFVHRNIANLLAHDDLSSQSVMFYAITVLRVAHVVICGHTGCGGVAAGLEGKPLGAIDEWLRPIQAARDKHADALAQVEAEQRVDLLAEINVREQLQHVAKSELVQNAWRQGQALTLHGWIYNLNDGLIKRLEMIGREEK